MNLLMVAVSGLWLSLPALLPNSAAVVFGGGAPMDMGRTWGGRRVLGDGKTWRGFIGGAMSGVVLGCILIGISSLAGWGGPWDFGGLPDALLPIAALAFGSLLGDLLGSLVKRRMGFERGARVPVLDQYDFLIGAYGLTALVSTGWFMGNFVEGDAIVALLFMVVVTPLMHRAVNIIGYRMGAKDVPW